MNKHQINSIEALLKRFENASDRKGADLLQAVLGNDHEGMLSSKIYWGSTNDMENIPAAACPRCGGWTASGGMSHYHNSTAKIDGRTGCCC